MTNPFNRGSAPGRARDPWQNPGAFEPRHAKTGGRKRGTRNLITPEHRAAVLEAADRVGYDGNGKDGVGGYFKYVGERDPTFFYVEVYPGGCIDLEIHEAAMRVEAAPRGTNELHEKTPSPLVRTKKVRRRQAPDAEVEGLMRLAMEQYKTFFRLFIAAFLTPPKGWRVRARKAGVLLC
jgi:hypothetical protein